MGFSTRSTDEMRGRYRRSGHWGDETFSTILERRAAEHPTREALVDRRHRVTYAELKTRVDRVAANLGELGIGPGDVVTIQLPNWVEFAYVFFACERVGRGGQPDRSRLPEPRGRVHPPLLREPRLRVSGELPRLRLRGDDRASCGRGCPICGSSACSAATARRGRSRARRPHRRHAPGRAASVPFQMGADDVMRMAFTSGTTGQPQGRDPQLQHDAAGCRHPQRGMDVTEDEVFLAYLPLGLNWGYLTLLQAIMVGRPRGAARPLQRRGPRSS